MASQPQILILTSGQPIQFVIESDAELELGRKIASMQRTGDKEINITLQGLLIADGAGEEVPVLRISM